ncbi:MAG: Msa family membrane protein [Streptococcus sp.]
MLILLITHLFTYDFGNYLLLPHMSVPILLFSLYVLPLIINFIGYKLKQLKCKTFLTFLLPTMSLLGYLVFAYVTVKSGTWTNFVNINTFSNSDMSVKVGMNLLSVSQLVFVTLLFYVVSLTTHFINKKISVNKG